MPCFPRLAPQSFLLAICLRKSEPSAACARPIPNPPPAPRTRKTRIRIPTKNEGCPSTAEATRVNKVVLIVGQATDPHVERVRQALEALGAVALVADPQRTADPAHVSFSFRDGECCFEARAARRAVVGRDLSAVWWRLKPGPEWPGQSREVREMHAFRRREWQHALEGLEGVLAHARWVN